MINKKMTYKPAPQDARFSGSPCGMRYNSGAQSAPVPATAPFLSFEAFDRLPYLKHGFSTRYGGVSTGYLSTMNLGFGRGDTPENLKENYRRMGAAIGFPAEDAVISDQTHTTNLRVVTAADKGKGLFRAKDYRDVDGLLTNEPGIPLVTLYADCVPLFFVDRTHRAIALSHSGWKGTVNHMAEVTMERMRREFGTEPADLAVAIGPSICQDCYEVTENVIKAFQASFPREIWKDLFYQKDEQHWQLNLWYASCWQFRNAGLTPAQISLPGVCTCCNPDFLFSHRASGGKRGNLGAFLMLCDPAV